jgi:Tfp pilus assembly protein PilZ
MAATYTKPPKEWNISAVTARVIELVLEMPHFERLALLEKLEKNHLAGKRKYPRKTYFMEVHFATPEQVSSGFIQDISNDGIFVETRDSFSIGQQITLTFRLPDSEEHLKISGQVVRLSYKGIGVKFKTNLDDLLREREEMMAQYL